MTSSSGRHGVDYAKVQRNQRHRSFHVIAMLLAAIIALAVGGVAWLGIKAAVISAELNAANTLIPKLRDDVIKDDAVTAVKHARELREHTVKAREATSDPIWTMAGAMPWLGANFRAASEIATSADDIAQLGVAPIVSTFKTLDWKALLPNGQGLDLAPLTVAGPKLASAAEAVRQSSDRLNGINAEGLMPQIAVPLDQARKQLAALRGGLQSAANAAQVVPSMLGKESPRHYLVLIQNNAEARATGGIPGALATLTLDAGKLSLGKQSSAGALGAFTPAVKVDLEQEQLYSSRLGRFMQDVNLTPDFPTTAKIAQSMWQTRTGEEVHGVLSIDPVALGYLLEGTGPVQLTDPSLQAFAKGQLPTELNARNIVTTLLSDVYEKIPETELQDAYFAGVAKEVFSQLSEGDADPQKLIEGLARGATERRILVWSREEAEQMVISKYPLGGSVIGDSISPAQFGVYFNDGTGAKMDYYIKRTVQLIEECTTDGYGQVKVQITSKNTAPADAVSSLPKYVTGGGAFGVSAGTVQSNIVAYGPIQAHVENALADGKKVGFNSQLHSGRPVGTVTVVLPPGKSSTVEFTFGRIVQEAEPKLAVTPTVQPLRDVALDTISKTCVPVP